MVILPDKITKKDFMTYIKDLKNDGIDITYDDEHKYCELKINGQGYMIRQGTYLAIMCYLQGLIDKEYENK